MSIDAHSPLEEGIGAFDNGDYIFAFKLLLPLAEAGNAKAQCYLGGMYQGGLGVPADGAQAVRWYLEAARQEIDVEHISATAYSNLATIYTVGMFGIGADKQLARSYAQMAERLGFQMR